MILNRVRWLFNEKGKDKDRGIGRIFIKWV